MELRTGKSNHCRGNAAEGLRNINNSKALAKMGWVDPFRERYAEPQTTSRPKPYERRALALLVGCGTERVMRMHGFTAYQLAELVRFGFATTSTERVVGEWRQPIEVKRLKIIEAAIGRSALGNDGARRRLSTPPCPLQCLALPSARPTAQ